MLTRGIKFSFKIDAPQAAICQHSAKAIGRLSLKFSGYKDGVLDNRLVVDIDPAYAKHIIHIFKV
jgi:hypothetical protein